MKKNLSRSHKKSTSQVPLVRLGLSDHAQTSPWKGKEITIITTIQYLVGPGPGWGVTFPDHMGARAPRQNQGFTRRKRMCVWGEGLCVCARMCSRICAHVYTCQCELLESRRQGWPQAGSLQCLSWKQWEGRQLSWNYTNKNEFAPKPSSQRSLFSPWAFSFQVNVVDPFYLEHAASLPGLNQAWLTSHCLQDRWTLSHQFPWLILEPLCSSSLFSSCCCCCFDNRTLHLHFLKEISIDTIELSLGNANVNNYSATKYYLKEKQNNKDCLGERVFSPKYFHIFNSCLSSLRPQRNKPLLAASPGTSLWPAPGTCLPW